jgi:hypothetical protein
LAPSRQSTPGHSPIVEGIFAIIALAELAARGKIIGVAGLIALLVSWAAIWAATSVVPPPWVPRVWLMTIVVALPCAVVAGVVAARMTAKWWYVLAGAGLLSAAFLLAGAAV